MKKIIIVFVVILVCLSVLSCKKVADNSSDVSSKAQQTMNTESDEQSVVELSNDEVSNDEVSNVELSSDEVSDDFTESSDEVSSVVSEEPTEPKLPDKNFFGIVCNVEKDAIIVQYYDYTTKTSNNIRVKCSNAEEFCEYDGVIITYSGVADRKISDNYYEITANNVVLEPGAAEKPVIYLYPTEEMDVSVKLYFEGDLFCTYPDYNDGWNVTARPDGTLINKADGKEYSYLFWEGYSDTEYDMSRGFVVKGAETAAFLQEKLSYLGLTPREYNEFIVYWLPKMQDNEYNLITFQGEAYTDNAVLDISPQPDSILRVFMAYKPLDEYVEIEEQELNTFKREGFTVIEWGGTSVN
ncbi:MAG: hypothetical protein PHD46_02595 [Eubacteriales bacterium]|nr:hypothetical protein [Eubacteriales bacterium]MDD4421906.1 hypothetical protein [Eubacteriales bacterium]